MELTVLSVDFSSNTDARCGRDGPLKSGPNSGVKNVNAMLRDPQGSGVFQVEPNGRWLDIPSPSLFSGSLPWDRPLVSSRLLGSPPVASSSAHSLTSSYLKDCTSRGCFVCGFDSFRNTSWSSLASFAIS